MESKGGEGRGEVEGAGEGSGGVGGERGEARYGRSEGRLSTTMCPDEVEGWQMK